MRDHSRLEVHLPRLARNWARVQALAPRARILPMVKAQAYGHGAVAVSRFLVDELGAQALGVATLGEGEELLRGLPQLQVPVHVFSDTNLGSTGARYEDARLRPVVADLAGLDHFLRDYGDRPLDLKINTGMNRLGLDEADWEEAAKRIRAAGRSGIDHLMAHFALSFHEIKPGDKCHRQRDAFARARALFEAHGLAVRETSQANSGAIEQGFTVDETWVRPGLMLYGPPSWRFNGEIVSSLVTRILKVFPVKRGTPVGYGVNVVPEDGLIAVLPLGYGDGLPTQAAGWRFQHAGFEAWVFGRVNMDMSFLFFPTAALGRVREGDEVRLWDADPAVLQSYADHMKTHAYQALCAISGRVPRVYHLN